MTPNLLRLARSCAKWRNGKLLVATLFSLLGAFAFAGNDGMAYPVKGAARLQPKPSPAPEAVTDLRVSMVSDTAVTLSWTDVTSGLTSTAAKYAVRFGPYESYTWAPGNDDVKAGGCAVPVYGSPTVSHRPRSCVLGGLIQGHRYRFQIVAYTGTLNLNAVFGPLSNIADEYTATRIGSLMVLRPRTVADSFHIDHAWISAFPLDTFPLRGWFNYGAYYMFGFERGDSLVARGYMVVVKP